MLAPWKDSTQDAIFVPGAPSHRLACAGCKPSNTPSHSERPTGVKNPENRGCIGTAIPLWILRCACSLGRPRFAQNDSLVGVSGTSPTQAKGWLAWGRTRRPATPMSQKRDMGHPAVLENDEKDIIRCNMPIQYIVFIAEVQTAQAGKLRAALTDAVNAGDDICLLISSGGGNVSEGLNIAAYMRTLPVEITTHNIGQTDSIANVIFSAGSKRYANANASFLFHGVSMHYERADFIESQLEEQYKIVKRLRENIASVFAAYAGISVIDVEALMISGATILNAQDALTKTIIHEVRDAKIPPNSKVVTIGNS